MPDDPIPEDVHRFLVRHIASVSELEALLTLVRDPRHWTVHELARALVINENHAGTLLAALVKTRLVASIDGAYVFRPAKRQDRAAAEGLAGLYDKYRLRIMNIIFTKPSEPLRDFADAFRLRSRDEDDDEEEGER